MTAEVNLKEYGYSAEQVAQFNETFSQRVAALPGVRSVALADYLPLDSRLLSLTYVVEGHGSPGWPGGFWPPDVRCRSRLLLHHGHEASSTVGNSLRTTDQVRHPWPSSIRLWPRGSGPARMPSAAGCRKAAFRRLRPPRSSGWWRTGKYRSLGEAPHPVVFRSRLQSSGPRSTFVVHVRGEVQAPWQEFVRWRRRSTRVWRCRGSGRWNNI